ncbi:MAG: hypothetical protein ACK528_07145 [Alphaproteobacteria bacterium]|jgi:hypothetical protein
MTQKKFKFEDLQPHIDMLCDALENRGASSSGIHNPSVSPYADKYRNLVSRIRDKSIDWDSLNLELVNLRICCTADCESQHYRVGLILAALDEFAKKEYHKVHKS